MEGVGGESAQQYAFVTAGGALQHDYIAPGQAESLRQESNQRRVGLAVHRRRLQSHAQGMLAVQAREFRTRRARGCLHA